MNGAMGRGHWIWGFVLIQGGMVWGAGLDEAKELKTEANKLLHSASGIQTNPKIYADAVRKLQQAMDLMDQLAEKKEYKDNKGFESLLEEISASLFWARRFANLNVAEELTKPGGSSSPSSTKPPTSPEPPAPPGPTAPPRPPAPPNPGIVPPTPQPIASKHPSPQKGQVTVEEAFRKAEEYEASHKGEDHQIAMRWFQMAEQYPGTDQSLRAIERAREAQSRHRAKMLAEDPPKDPRGKLMAEGNQLFERKNYEDALTKFEAAKGITDDTEVERRIGQTWLRIGFGVRDQYAKEYIALRQAYDQARARGQLALAQGFIRKLKELDPLVAKAIGHYEKGRTAFQRGLEKAKNMDIGCEAGLAIILYEKLLKIPARQALATVLNKYAPCNDEERTLYEYCRTMLKVIDRRF